MAKDTPFGQGTRIRVLKEYLEQAGELTEANAWEHVYQCLLWFDIGASLAHIYDSNVSSFLEIAARVGPIVEADVSAVLQTLLAKPISVLARRGVGPRAEIMERSGHGDRTHYIRHHHD
jgi:hypothetical protein